MVFRRVFYLRATFGYYFICELFSFMNNVNFPSYVDDNALYVIGDGVIEVTASLKEASGKLFLWFANNQMKANPYKRHLITGSSEYVRRQLQHKK